MKNAPNFNGLARPYQWMETLTFGPFLARCRNAFLPHLSGRRNALVLGDGDGRFTARLLRENPAVQVDAVDASWAMLASLQRRAAPHQQRVRPHLADARAWQPGASTAPPFDLIASHFFLDCLTEPEILDLAHRIMARAAPGAVWVVSDFAIPPGWFGRLAARPLVWFLYRTFRLLTGLRVQALPDHGRALRMAGFALAGERRFLAGLLVSQLWTVVPQAK